jgi:hypothetical protein
MIIAMAVIIPGILLYALWANGGLLPGWILWEKSSTLNAAGGYEISLSDRSVHVVCDGESIWDSPQGVKVQQVLSADIDRDGEEELILLCWKRGRFGEHKPFWIKKDERGWSQHIFVYQYAGDEIRPMWMSSQIGEDVVSMACVGKKSGERLLCLTDRMGDNGYWRWGSWGFAKETAEVSFVVFGDNIIHEPIYICGLNRGGNFDFLFEQVKEKVEESDISVINQETPLVRDPADYGSYPLFGTPIQVGEAVVQAGFDVVTCATNHALDRGAEGIHTTKEFFAGEDVLCLGIQTAEEAERKPYEMLSRHGMKFALFNYTYGTNGISAPEEYPDMVHLLENEKQIREDLQKAGEEADAVLVFVHWGTEYADNLDAFQEKWTEVFLEEKVDVVVGAHPHVLQPFEMLEGVDGHRMLVYYSIGNFVSAQPEKACVRGGMAYFTMVPGEEGQVVTEYGLSPLTIKWQEGGGYAPYFSENVLVPGKT